MITRLYANNFRCLVAFEAQFDSFGVLCGPNGAGKSSVFDALRLLRNLGTGDALLGGTGEQDVPGLDFITIERELSQLLQGRRVDMVTPKFLNARVRDQVLTSAEPLYVAA